MSNMIKFNYEGQAISFEFSDGNKMINASEMIKPFEGKRMNNFLRSQQTKAYIQVLEIESEGKEVLRVVKGGISPELQGTWMSEKLALKFASWLCFYLEIISRTMGKTGNNQRNCQRRTRPSS